MVSSRAPHSQHNLRTQFRVSWRCADWPASKPTAVRVFRYDALAVQFARRLRADSTQGAVSIVVEMREVSSTPWRPMDLGGGR